MRTSARLSVAAFVAVLVISLPAVASAAQVHVEMSGSDITGDGSVANPYATVQHAIDMASPGDTVTVGAGTFFDNVTMADGVSLRGAGPASTTLEGTGGPVITCDGIGAGETISGFTVTGGMNFEGGGISVTGVGDSPAIINNTITGNYAEMGAGVYCGAGSAPTVSGNTISENTGAYGAGIYCELGSVASITGNMISGNTGSGGPGTGGGGIYLSTCAGSVAGNTITGNSAIAGAGVYCFGSSTTIVENRIADNVGGGVVSDSADGTITGNTINGNTVSTYGGGVLCVGMTASSPRITNNTICGNSAGTYGGGVFVGGDATPVLTNDTIVGNTASGGVGGGVYSFAGPFSITNCILWGNGDDLYDCSATYSDIEDGDAGTGNISAAPGFVSTGTGDYHLRAGSPCIDSADGSASPATDKDGLARPQGAGADMGAYEYGLLQHEQTDAALVYTGTWQTAALSGMSGGSFARTRSAGAAMNAVFDGSTVEWITYKGPNCGRARVYVDGSLETTVDLYAKTSAYRTTVWRKDGLDPDVPHTLRIECSGEATPTAVDKLIGVDALRVYGVLTPATDPLTSYEQTATALVYTGSWQTAALSGMSGGSFARTRSAGAAMNAAFEGSAIEWITYKGPNCGRARVYVDGALAGTVDLYARTSAYQTCVWRTGGLDTGVPHTLRIECTAEGTATAVDKLIGVDALRVYGALTPATDPLTSYEQTDAALVYSGTWQTAVLSGMSGGSFVRTRSAGAAMDVVFEGSAVEWITYKGPNCGRARVYVDGSFETTVDLYARTSAYQATVWRKDGLDPDVPHTLRIECSGEATPTAVDKLIGVDAVRVWGSLTP